jgi:hypothetical protein
MLRRPRYLPGLSRRLFVLSLTLLLITTPAWSTRPLIDRIEFEGGEHEFFPVGKPWLDYPENDKTSEIHRAQQCSAIGGLRATWLFKDDQLWLTGFFSCGKKYTLPEIYPNEQSAIHATWINAQIAVEHGRVLCVSTGVGPIIRQKTTWLTFKSGILTQRRLTDNGNDPAMPTVQELKKLKLKAGEIAPCMDQTLRRILASEK